MRYMLTTPIWQELKPRVEAAKRSAAGAKPELPDRLFLEAILYRARTGTPWRDLPAEFGDWNAVYQRAKRRAKPGSGTGCSTTSRPTTRQPKSVVCSWTRQLSAPTRMLPGRKKGR